MHLRQQMQQATDNRVQQTAEVQTSHTQGQGACLALHSGFTACKLCNGVSCAGGLVSQTTKPQRCTTPAVGEACRSITRSLVCLLNAYKGEMTMSTVNEVCADTSRGIYACVECWIADSGWILGSCSWPIPRRGLPPTHVEAAGLAASAVSASQ